MRNLDKIFRNDDLEAHIATWGEPATFQGAEYCVGNYETVGVLDTKQQRLLIAVSGQPEHGHFEMALISTATAILNNTLAPSEGEQRYYIELVETNQGSMVFVCDKTPPNGMAHFLLRGPAGRVQNRHSVIEAAAKIAAGLNSMNYVYHAYDDTERFSDEELAEIQAGDLAA